MQRYSLAHLTEGALFDGLKRNLARERDALALVLAHIAEVEARELYKQAGYSSMHMYCVHELHLSKDAANKRIRAAKTARKFPGAFEKVEQGALRLTSLLILSPHLTPAFRSDFEVKEILAERFPQAPVPTTIEPIAEPQTLVAESVVEHAVVAAQPLQGIVNQLHVTPIAPQLYKAQLTMSRVMHDKLARAKDLLGYRKSVPDEAEILTYESESGTRCPETSGLEWDHILPVARGGDSRASNIRLRCRAHNQLEAERAFGRTFMQNKRGSARAAAAKRRAEREAKRAAEEALDHDELMPGLRGLGFTKEESRFALTECGPMEGQALEARLRRCLAILSPPHRSVHPRAAMQ